MTPQARFKKAEAALAKAQAEYAAALKVLPMFGDKQRHKESHFQGIVHALETVGEMRPSDLAHNLRIHRVSVHRYLKEMIARDIIQKTAAGFYSVKRREPHVKSKGRKP